MRKPIEQMTEREMLAELLREKRNADTRRFIKLCFYALIAAAIIILCVKYLPPVIAYFRKLNETVQQIQQALQELQNTTDHVKSTIAGIGQSGSDALQTAIEKINELLEKIPGIFR